MYVADGPAGLLIIDVSSPDHPRIAGLVMPPGIVAHGVDVIGQIAVVAAGFSGIQVFNVANPTAPVLLGSVGLPDETKDVVVNGTIAYVADYQAAFRRSTSAFRRRRGSFHPRCRSTRTTAAI